MYADLLRYLAGVNWEDPHAVKEAITRLMELLETKLTDLNTRVTALE